MADVFGNDTVITSNNRILSTNNVILSMNNKLSLAQSATIEYGQTANPVYEIGSATTYYVVGNPTGTIALASVAGPGSGLLGGFTNNISTDCAFSSFSVKTEGGCASLSAETSISCKACMPVKIGVQIQAQQLTVTSSLQMIFASFEV